MLKQLAVLLAVASNAAAFYSSKGSVINLDNKNFETQVFGSDHAWVIEFYAPWCGHCQKLAPDYKKVADNLDGLVKVGAIDCNEDANKGICSSYGVQGFPTIKGFHGKRKVNKSNPKKSTKTSSDHNGARSPKAIADFGISLIPDFVTKLINSKLDDFLEKDNSTFPKAILFSEKSVATPMYKAIAVDLKDKMHVAQVKSSEAKVVERFGVTKFPTVVVIPTDGESLTYNGKIKKVELLEFLSQYARDSSDTTTSGEEKASKAPPFDPTPMPLSSLSELEQKCISPPASEMAICFIALLQKSADSYIADFDILKELKGSLGHPKAEGAKIHFFHVPVEDEPATDALSSTLTKSLDLPEGQYPFVLAIHPRREMYQKFLGAYEKYDPKRKMGTDLRDFIADVRQLRGRWYKLPPSLKAPSAKDEL